MLVVKSGAYPSAFRLRFKLIVGLGYCYNKCRKVGLYAECHYADCRYAECCYAECHGAQGK